MVSSRACSRASTFASSRSTEMAPVVDRDIERGCESLSPEAKHNMPWQYHGYPALSQWMASANDFFVLRRFSPLQVRCLLYLQNEIALKDEQLRGWDRFAKCQAPGEGNSGWINQDPEAFAKFNNPRPRILRDLVPMLQQYNDLVHSFSQMKAKETASEFHTRNIDNWFANNGADAIDPTEQHYKDHQGDLVTMLSKPKYPLIALLHRSRMIRRLLKLPVKRRSDRIDAESTTYTSNSGLEALAAFLSLTVGLSMTFASIWWLNFVDSTTYRLAIITASGSLMTLIAWAAAGNRPFEILATFAAYMAVLMIYQQIGP